MDRRDFFKTVFATPLLTPFLLGSPSSANDELLLISDNPEIFLPSLLEKMENQEKTSRRSYSVSNFHPRNDALSRTLKSSGWAKASPDHPADLLLSSTSFSAVFHLSQSGKDFGYPHKRAV